MAHFSHTPCIRNFLEGVKEVATIATHNGSKVCREHNIRSPHVVSKLSHIDPHGRYEVLKDEKVREAYKRLFGAAQIAYNQRQTKEDRKIYDYFQTVERDAKKHVAYEMIVGVYGADVSEREKEEIIKEFAAGWDERNPNLEVIGCYFHADEEGGMHIHIDYIPVARHLTRGMAVQNSLTQALGQMGFKTTKSRHTAQMQWEKRENLYLEELCRERGINVERPIGEREHIETDLYKLTKEHEKVENRLTETLERQKASEAEVNALRAQRGGFGRIGPLQKDIADLKRDKELLERELQKKDGEISRLKNEVHQLGKLTPGIDHELQRVHDQRRIQELETENKELKGKLERVLAFLKEHFPPIYAAVDKILANRHRDRGADVEK